MFLVSLKFNTCVPTIIVNVGFIDYIVNTLIYGSTYISIVIEHYLFT